MKKILFSIYFLTTSYLLQAGGFQVNTQGQKALGVAGAYTAMSRDASAVFYNPAAMAMLDSSMLSVGATMVRPITTFRSLSTGVGTDADTKTILPAYLYLNYAISDKFAAGISLTSPFAFGTKWNDNWEGRNVVQEMNLNTYYLQPTLSYQFTDRFSVGAGLIVARGNFDFRRQIGEFNGNLELSGNGTGYGFNAGVFGRIQENISFGVTYRSAVDMDIKGGEASFTNIPAGMTGMYPASAKFNSRLNLPSTLSVGVSDRINDKINISFDFNITGWSAYDSLIFNFENPGTPDSRAPRRYEDAMAFRIGSEYRHSDNFTFRAGVFYDESPVRDEYISPEVADGNRLGFTAGLSYRLSSRISADAAYSFENVAERRVKDPTNAQISNLGGTYKTFVHSAGIGLNYHF